MGGSDNNQMQSNERISPMTGYGVRMIKTTRNNNGDSDSFNQTLQNFSQCDFNYHNNEIRTHRPRVRGFEKLSIGSGEHGFMRNT